MELDWTSLERWLMGEAWIGSQIRPHLIHLCDTIGPRWSSSAAEKETVTYIRHELARAGLDDAALAEYQLETWQLESHAAELVEEALPFPILPFNCCPPVHVTAPLVDAGYGTPHLLERLDASLQGSVVLMTLGFEPFTTPIPHGYRLKALAAAGARAAIVVDRKEGGRVEYHNVGDWRDPGIQEHPLPTVAVTREIGARLRRAVAAGRSVRLDVESRFFQAPSWNVTASLPGVRWPDEHLLIGGHHDTVYAAPGGNDNASGVVVILETARILARLANELGVGPGRSIRFVTFGAEEQQFQGASAYVRSHYSSGDAPRLAINLDELSTGHFKGLVLAFPHLRELIQRQFDEMGDGHVCHVMSQLDTTSDHFPFLAAGLDAAHLWRWRFHGRHADADFHHEPGDTPDKVNLRELKEYSGQLARLLLRLSHIPR